MSEDKLIRFTDSGNNTLFRIPDGANIILSYDDGSQQIMPCRYICVNEIGESVKPSYLTSALPNLLKKHNMRVIRFHDLRHTCASLLLANGVSMKQIQE